MNNTKRLIRNIFIVIFSNIGLMIFAFLVFIYCYLVLFEGREFFVRAEKKEEIECFLTLFYDEMLDDFSNTDTIATSYLDKKINFRVKKSAYTEKDFCTLYKEFRDIVGMRFKNTNYEISFSMTSYGVDIRDFYSIKLSVEYEYGTTSESFILKETELGWKIYFYDIFIY